MTNPPQDATREKLLKAARAQFAARGFYGASIAQIAGELGLTKQALLYHFKRKEDLYAEVIKGISVRLMKGIKHSVDPASSPADQFEALVLGLYETALISPLDTKVLMRELLDNQRQAAPPEQWYLKTFLDELVRRLDATGEVSALPQSRKLAGVYMLLSSIEYFAASGATLKRFYGEDEFVKIAQSYREELRGQVHRLIAERAES